MCWELLFEDVNNFSRLSESPNPQSGGSRYHDDPYPPPAPSPPALISLSFGVCCGMSQLALSISVRRSASFGLSVLRMRLLHHVVVHLSIFSISDF